MKALILGSTGLVGGELLNLLINDNRFDKIHLINRRKSGVLNEKVKEHLIDFELFEDIDLPPIEVLYIAFGTTIKTAGSKENQWKIDVDIPTKVMKFAKGKGVENCVLISSLGVSKKSMFFYSRMKAQLDENAINCGFNKLTIIKPSVLDGNRKEERFGEKFSIQIGNLLGKTGLIDAYRPVKAKNVAATMIQSSIESIEKQTEIVSKDIPSWAKRYFSN
jgi:uncharacterized protein YbjT (DUF2867 family)